MSHGAQIFIKGTAFDVVNAFSANYVLAVFDISGSGGREFSVPPGYSLTAKAYFMGGTIEKIIHPTIRIADNKVTWDANSGLTFKIVIWCN